MKPSSTISATREKNYLILRLRGIYASFSSMSIGNGKHPVFTLEESSQGKQIINQALTRLGAKTEYQRQEEFRQRWQQEQDNDGA